jgi:hypothetical protein
MESYAAKLDPENEVQRMGRGRFRLSDQPSLFDV